MACLSASGPCVYTVLRIIPALIITYCSKYTYEPAYYEAVENINKTFDIVLFLDTCH
jgi:hypothetical protein